MSVPLLFFFGVVAGIFISLAFLHYVPLFISEKAVGKEGAVFSNRSYSTVYYVLSLYYVLCYIHEYNG